MKTLSQVAQELNTASKVLNGKYTSFEAKLKESNLGVKATVTASDKLKLSYESGSEGWGVYITSEDIHIWRAINSPRAFRLICYLYLPALEDALIQVAENLIERMEKIK